MPKKHFFQTSLKVNLLPEIIEKDFWVVYFLDFLFNKSIYKNEFVFKGGTCLSKCYSLINRFSEDLDIVMTFKTIGVNHNDALIKKGTHQLQKFKDKVETLEINFFNNKLIPEIESYVKRNVKGKFDIKLVYKKHNSYIDIQYPTIYQHIVLPSIRLEIGTLAAIKPTNTSIVKPYTDKILNVDGAKIKCTTDSFIFWEKTLILHKINKKQLKTGKRLSRHFYDMYCLYINNVINNALRDFKLLNFAIFMNNIFYPDKDAEFEKIKISGFDLLPKFEKLKILIEDYDQMKPMFFGSILSFNKILYVLNNIEKILNDSISKRFDYIKNLLLSYTEVSK